MNENKWPKGLVVVAVASILATLVAAGQIISSYNSLAFYNMVRALIFSLASMYIYMNPTKINFTGPLRSNGDGDASDRNIGIAFFLAYLFSAFNLAISLALYFDP